MQKALLCWFVGFVAILLLCEGLYVGTANWVAHNLPLFGVVALLATMLGRMWGAVSSVAGLALGVLIADPLADPSYRAQVARYADGPYPTHGGWVIVSALFLVFTVVGTVVGLRQQLVRQTA